MRPDRNRLLEFSAPGFGDGHLARRGIASLRHRRGIEVAVGPGRQHVGDIDRIAALAEQVVGAGERDEALGMLCRQEDLRRVLNPDQLVGRRMEDQQRLLQLRDARGELLP